MNKRIEELVTATDAWCDQNFPPDWTDRVDEFLPLWNEKFAELLIKECAKTAAYFSMKNKRIHPDIDPRDMSEANRMVYHSTCRCVASDIKEHFGVEE